MRVRRIEPGRQVGPVGRSPQSRQVIRARLPCNSITSGGAGRLVQAVHVLRDDPVDHAELLQRGDRTVARVGPGVADAAPAEVTARPVAPAGQRVTGERLVGHRRTAPGRAGRPPVVRDPGVGGQPRAAEDHDAALGHPLAELGDLLHHVKVHACNGASASDRAAGGGNRSEVVHVSAGNGKLIGVSALVHVLPRYWDGRRLLRFLTGLAMLALAFTADVPAAPPAVVAAPPAVAVAAPAPAAFEPPAPAQAAAPAPAQAAPATPVAAGRCGSGERLRPASAFAVEPIPVGPGLVDRARRAGGAHPSGPRRTRTTGRRLTTRARSTPFGASPCGVGLRPVDPVRNRVSPNSCVSRAIRVSL